MAEATGGSAPEDDLGKRIQAYLDSPKGQAAFQEGFASQSQFLTLDQFKKRKSDPGVSYTLGQGKLHQGGATGPKGLKSLCRELGHRWQEVPEIFVSTCVRCGLERKESAPDDTEEDDDVAIELICIWCGSLRRDLDDLERHEYECAPD